MNIKYNQGAIKDIRSTSGRIINNPTVSVIKIDVDGEGIFTCNVDPLELHDIKSKIEYDIENDRYEYHVIQCSNIQIPGEQCIPIGKIIFSIWDDVEVFEVDICCNAELVRKYSAEGKFGYSRVLNHFVLGGEPINV